MNDPNPRRKFFVMLNILAAIKNNKIFEILKKVLIYQVNQPFELVFLYDPSLNKSSPLNSINQLDNHMLVHI